MSVDLIANIDFVVSGLSGYQTWLDGWLAGWLNGSARIMQIIFVGKSI